MSAWDKSALDNVGLNLQAVFNLDELPADIIAEIRRRFDDTERYRQLILIGHAGTRLWSAVQAAEIESENPIDDFSVRTVRNWLAAQQPDARYEVIFPGDGEVGLQTLGRLAGWHHDSPLMVGINEKWGMWFAYRVVVLADTGFPASRSETSHSPCEACRDRTCIAACPANALAEGTLRLERCVAYRKSSTSRCKATCLARLACPVGAEHRYCEAQIRHTYSISMRTIEQYY